MEFWFLWVITAAAVVGAVLGLLVAHENFLSSTRLVSMVSQHALRRSSRVLLAGTALLVLSVGASLTLLTDEHARRVALEQQVSQLQIQVATAEAGASPPPGDAPIAEAMTVEDAPMVPVAIQDREDLALIEAVPEFNSASENTSPADTWRISAPSLNLRRAPNGAVIRSLRRGHRVRLIRELIIENKRWALVRSLEVNEEGWVSRAFITTGKPQS